MDKQISPMNRATIISKKTCLVSAEFEEFQGWAAKYAKDSRVSSFLSESDFQKEYFRGYIAKEDHIFIILGTIIIDEIIKNAEEDTVAQVKRAFGYISENNIPLKLDSAKSNFLSVVDLVKTERQRLMNDRKMNGQTKQLYEMIYQQFVNENASLLAIAEAARALMIKRFHQNSNQPSSKEILSAILEEKSLSSYYKLLISNFVAVLPYEIRLIKIQEGKNFRIESEAFRGNFNTLRIRANWLQIKSETSLLNFMCYNASDLTRDSPDNKQNSGAALLNSLKQNPIQSEIVLNVSRNNSKASNKQDQKENDVSCTKCKKIFQSNQLLKRSGCHHQYCFSCLFDHIRNLTGLIQGNCSSCNISQSELREFFKQFLNEDSAYSIVFSQMEEKSHRNVEENKSNGIQSKLTPYVFCHGCKTQTETTSTYNLPLCKHMICLECYQIYSVMNSQRGDGCIVIDCIYRTKGSSETNFLPNQQPRLVNVNGSNHNSPIPAIQKNEETQKMSLSQCKDCKTLRASAEFELFSTCGHKICRSCTKISNMKNTEHLDYLLCPSCYYDIKANNEIKTNSIKANNDIKTNGIKPHEVKADIIPMIQTQFRACITCKAKIELPLKRDGVPQCVKCPQCKTSICLDHDCMLSDCFCYCAGCLTFMKLDLKTNFKHCSKCKLKLCLNCRSKPNEVCRCSQCKVCFNINTHEEYSVCVQCRRNNKICSSCFDPLLEESQVELYCGHKICRSCKFERFQDANVYEMACVICDLLMNSSVRCSAFYS